MRFAPPVSPPAGVQHNRPLEHSLRKRAAFWRPWPALAVFFLLTPAVLSLPLRAVSPAEQLKGRPVSCETSAASPAGETCEALVVRTWLQSLFDGIGSMPLVLFPASEDEILRRLSLSVKANYFSRTTVGEVVCARGGHPWEFSEIKAHFDTFMVRGFPFEEVVLSLRNVALDPSAMKGSAPASAILRMETPVMEIRAEASKVSSFFMEEGRKFGISLPGISIEGEKIKVSGRLKILWCDMVVAADLVPEASSGGEIYLKAEGMKVAGIRLPRFVVGKIMKTFNPVIAIVEGRVPFGLMPSSFGVVRDRLVIMSRGEPVKPAP